jgi:molybdopterin-guanine dinucleotide biosynthesis protein A
MPACQLPSLTRNDITGLILAGGRGSRMGGLDKGLIQLHALPQAQWLAQQLQQQTAGVMISANRHIPIYQSFGFPVIQDADDAFAGPLAGILAALKCCPTPLLLITPCDTPQVHPELATMLLDSLQQSHRQLSYIREISETDEPRDHPSFALLHRELADSLEIYLATGQRRVLQWFREQNAAVCSVPDHISFHNLNTPEAVKAFRKG